MITTELFGLVPAFLARFVNEAGSSTLWILLSVVLVLCLCVQSVYLRQGKRKHEGEVARLNEEANYWQHQAERAQVNLLNEQLNPHFLFNNLGSLSTLIEEDQPAAVQFVEELSGVYRYVLKVYNSSLTSLGDEVEFLDNYFRLLKIRFGQNLQLDIDIPPQYENYLLPPLTLQLLLENAVKHNVVTNEKPLYISIRLIENRLFIENNIQPKATSLFSGKIGLQNIREKYKLLEAGEVEVLNSGSAFRVTVPLIQPVG